MQILKDNLSIIFLIYLKSVYNDLFFWERRFFIVSKQKKSTKNTKD